MHAATMITWPSRSFVPKPLWIALEAGVLLVRACVRVCAHVYMRVCVHAHVRPRVCAAGTACVPGMAPHPSTSDRQRGLPRARACQGTWVVTVHLQRCGHWAVWSGPGEDGVAPVTIMVTILLTALTASCCAVLCPAADVGAAGRRLLWGLVTLRLCQPGWVSRGDQQGLPASSMTACLAGCMRTDHRCLTTNLRGSLSQCPAAPS